MRWGWFLVTVCALGAPSLSPCSADEAPDTTTARVLSRWEVAASGLLGVGPMEHRRLYYLYQGEHSAHEIALLNEFRGPVSAKKLAERFDWSLQESAGNILLVGTPLEQVEKLFYEKVTVQIDAKTHLPLAVQFAGKDQTVLSEPLDVVLSPRAEQPNLFSPDPSAQPIQVAFREEDVPRNHSPVRVVEHITQKPVPDQQLPREVQKALSIWEASAGEVQSLQANIKRFTYENQSHIEQRAVGEFSYSKIPVIQCTLKPAVLNPNQQSGRRTAGGEMYELLPSPAEFWQYTPSEIRFSHQPDRPGFVLHRTADNPARVRAVSHKEMLGDKDQMIPPWDMLFQISAKALAERFDVRVTHNPHLMDWSFIPRKRDDIGRFREMRVLLDNTTWQPQAVKLIDRAGEIEQVYTFHYTEVQRQTRAGQEPPRLPLKPDSPKRQPAPTDLHGQP